MQIKDINGNLIKVTDLPKAIAQAEEFMGYRHEDKSFRKLDEHLLQYWIDLHKKLLKLQNKLNNNQNKTL